MWADNDRMAYEIQTNAREDAILTNAKKKEKYKILIMWISYDESILEDIKKSTENKDDYLLIKV
jgi:hypothetical protein